jgi:aldehyde:ferredoxin oxidoreductase
MGAVMGSKNLKALVCKGSHKPAVFDSEKVKTYTKRMLQESKDSPSTRHPWASLWNVY